MCEWDKNCTLRLPLRKKVKSLNLPLVYLVPWGEGLDPASRCPSFPSAGLGLGKHVS